jgi:hypothetical protein
MLATSNEIIDPDSDGLPMPDNTKQCLNSIER